MTRAVTQLPRCSSCRTLAAAMLVPHAFGALSDLMVWPRVVATRPQGAQRPEVCVSMLDFEYLTFLVAEGWAWIGVRPVGGRER